MAHVTQGFLHKLRTRMFAGMQKLPIRYFDQNSRGDIMSYYTERHRHAPPARLAEPAAAVRVGADGAGAAAVHAVFLPSR
ncbi:MAG: hypothetical protein ACLU3I_02915 [Acutalibacteraceae bacterium]